jgi:hypothetical protein
VPSAFQRRLIHFLWHLLYLLCPAIDRIGPRGQSLEVRRIIFSGLLLPKEKGLIPCPARDESGILTL